MRGDGGVPARRAGHHLEIFGDGEDVLQRVQLELVEVLVGRTLHLQLPPVDALRAGSSSKRRGRAAAQRLLSEGAHDGGGVDGGGWRV